LSIVYAIRTETATTTFRRLSDSYQTSAKVPRSISYIQSFNWSGPKCLQNASKTLQKCRQMSSKKPLPQGMLEAVEDFFCQVSDVFTTRKKPFRSDNLTKVGEDVKSFIPDQKRANSDSCEAAGLILGNTALTC
jgi:hypothetical protein